ncbi:MAG: hypothetical protein M3Y65_17400, partial [Pseudomonadota bacterium]|nr:hypothetical protein [Pseudomonadota bacterium]
KTEPSHVNKCMSEKWYRDFLVAQVYPLAKIHMADELRMVGINTSRVKGYDVYGGKFESVDPQGKNKSAPVKKPKINVTRNKKSN